MRTETQKKNVLMHLVRYGTITPWDALSNYGCFRLSSIIHRLRRDGNQISTELTGKEKYATYKLVTNEITD